jgi:hypothetical protein
MTRKQRFRRVKWKVRRVDEGWLPIIMIGEEPIAFPIMGTRHEARNLARDRAQEMRSAGQA